MPLVDFLKYVENPQNVSEDTREDAFVSMVEERIRSIKRSRTWEAKFMRLEIELMERWQEGRDEGLKAGLKEGSQAGKDRVNKLNELLAQKGRVDDIVKAATDSNFQEELFEEFGL